MLFYLVTSNLKNYSIWEDINYSLKSLYPLCYLLDGYKKAPNSLKVKGFCGPDGTRTRDLRRDRAAF